MSLGGNGPREGTAASTAIPERQAAASAENSSARETTALAAGASLAAKRCTRRAETRGDSNARAYSIRAAFAFSLCGCTFRAIPLMAPPIEQAQGHDDNPRPIPTRTARCNALARPGTVQMAKIGSHHRASAHLLHREGDGKGGKHRGNLNLHLEIGFRFPRCFPPFLPRVSPFPTNL